MSYENHICLSERDLLRKKIYWLIMDASKSLSEGSCRLTNILGKHYVYINGKIAAKEGRWNRDCALTHNRK